MASGSEHRRATLRASVVASIAALAVTRGDAAAAAAALLCGLAGLAVNPDLDAIEAEMGTVQRIAAALVWLWFALVLVA